MVEHIQYSKKLLSLEKFLQKQTDTPVVLVQGLGFVGSVMSLVVANAINGDYAVKRSIFLKKTLDRVCIF
jgi:hypothetical protein